MRIILLCLLLCCGTAFGQEKFSVGGDLRIRSEFDDRPAPQQDRLRERLRLRVWARGPLSETVDMTLQARTSPPDLPISANYSFYNSQDEPETFAFIPDQMFLRYHPQGKRGFEATLGKSPQLQGTSSPYSRLIWDNDYAAFGLWAGWKEADWHVRAGHFWLDFAPRYVGYTSQIVNGRYKVSDNVRFDVSYYNFEERPGFPIAESVSVNRGNAIARGDFASDFGLLETQVNTNFELAEIPVAIGLWHVKNLRAANDRDRGWSTGVDLFKLKDQGDVQLWYQYAYIEQDAIFSPVAQDDSILSTNFSGHRGGVRYNVAENMRLELWMLDSTRLFPEGLTSTRYRLDYYLFF